jgi:glycosyltransferase involved in cell wall biosynthesis
MVERPLVSIVTPSFNSGRFIDATIRSVLEQDYPNIEYLVMDGGSTDATLDILRGYERSHERSHEGRLRYISEHDKGQASAVNRGFHMTRGSIFAFLNADDTYLPGAISTAVEAFAMHPKPAVVYGDAWHVAEDGTRISPYPVEPFDANRLARRCFICQPAAFFRREAFAASGMLDATMHFAHDYDLWIRIAHRYTMLKLDAFLATSRMHPESKTMGQTSIAMRETLELLKRHYGYVPYNWLYGYGHHRLTGQAIAIDPPRAAVRSACYSMAMGARYNWRHPLRYFRDIVATAREGLA